MRSRIPKTKTFDGCWTCRQRKLKCPGPRPKCSRCARAGRFCQGFDIKLSWVPQSPGSSRQRSAPGLHRQRIAIPRGTQVLDSYKPSNADRLLEILEECTKVPNCDAFAGPFSIFRLDAQPSSGSNQSQLIEIGAPQPPNLNFPSSLVLAPDSDNQHTSASTAAESETVDRPNPSTIQTSSTAILPSLNNHDILTDSLFTHYISQLADILQPIHHPQNPFRTIHVRYAMVAFSATVPDTAFSIQCRPTRNEAILHSLISTSAFHLRGYDNTRHTGWAKYDEIGRYHRLQALRCLQQELLEPPKTAEVLYATMSAILTLVTSDLVEGDSAEFLTHLVGCHQLRHMSVAQGLSNEAYAPYMRQLDIAAHFLTTLALTTAQHLPHMRLFPPLTDSASIHDTPFSEADSCLEFTYGVTSSIASSIYLTNKLWHYTTLIKPTRNAFVVKIYDAILQLADFVDSWMPSTELFTSIETTDTTTLSLARNLAISFHCAAQIYFRSCFDIDCLNTDRIYLADLSRDTLLALERAESDKAQLPKAGASFGWPAFVAACEAPTDLRPRWSLYWRKLLSYRIGVVKRAWKVVEEVWRRQNHGRPRHTLLWFGQPAGTNHPTIRISEPVWTAVLEDWSMTILAA